jgi:penicillin G amidase
MARRSVVLGAVAVVVLLAAAIAVGGLLYLRRVKPDYEALIGGAAVQAPVEVWHDSAGVPHLWAKSDADLYFAQGYMHAQERLWQLELFRRVAEGRLSEVFGESMIDTDKFLRTIGLWRAAGVNEKRLEPEMRVLLNSYVAGVNHWITNSKEMLPPEFVTLRIKPELWTVQHSLAVEKIMAWDLTIYDGAAALTQAVRRIGADKAKYLTPSDPPWGATIVELPSVPAIPKPAALLLDALSITRASNAWVVGGNRSKSGKPILANDMHLALRQPGVWYLMALHAPGLDVAGMSLPGVPNIIAGHNQAVAWGFTNVMLDDVDFFIERPDPRDPNKYLTPAGSEPFGVTTETMFVKGRKQPIRFQVRTTRHGPIISDVEKRMRGADVIAMQWAALDSSHSLQAFPRFNRARSAAELLAAVPFFDNPHQNIVFADTSGHFGYQMGGRIPIRGTRKRPPMLPMPGWTGEWDWNGYIPFAEQPKAHDPTNGFAVTANNRQARGPIGDLISNDWDLPFRAMRIREMILAEPLHDAASVHRMQLDVTDLMAVRYRDHAEVAARMANLNEVAQQIAGWDGVAERGSTAAAYYYAWYETLRKKVARNLFASDTGNISRDALNTVLDSGSIGWLGAGGASVLDSLSREAMREADALARGKTWGDLHQVVIQHAMGEVPALAKLLDLNVGPRPHRGSATTVNVAQYIASGFPIRTSYGASQRHVVDLADIDGPGGFILPTGQSGLPASPHYQDMFARWYDGGLWQIPLDRRKAELRTVHRTTIQPE